MAWELVEVLQAQLRARDVTNSGVLGVAETREVLESLGLGPIEVETVLAETNAERTGMVRHAQFARVAGQLLSDMMREERELEMRDMFDRADKVRASCLMFRAADIVVVGLLLMCVLATWGPLVVCLLAGRERSPRHLGAFGVAAIRDAGTVSDSNAARDAGCGPKPGWLGVRVGWLTAVMMWVVFCGWVGIHAPDRTVWLITRSSFR